jgi:hypothetical protein
MSWYRSVLVLTLTVGVSGAAFAQDFLVADWHGHAIQRFAPDGSFVGTFGTTGASMYPHNVRIGLDGNVYTAGSYGPVYKFSSAGNFLGTIGPYINFATDVAADANGIVYVADWDGLIRRFDSAGNELSSLPVSHCGTLILDENGVLYANERATGAIRRFAPDGTELAPFPSSYQPRSFWRDTNGDFYFVQIGVNNVARLNANGSFIASYLSNLSNSEGVIRTPGGIFLVAGTGSQSVQFFGEDGTYYGHTEYGHTSYPTGLVFAPAESVSGKVILQDYDGAAGSLVTVEIRPVGSTTAVDSGTVPVDANGNFRLNTNVPPGNYDIAVKGSHWLRQTLSNQTVILGGLGGLTFSLVNGDVNGDNVVSLGDFTRFRAAFGSTAGDGNWNPAADLNGDGVVSLQDFTTLRAHFGQQGDP